MNQELETIYGGQGLITCWIGASRETVIDAFGEPPRKPFKTHNDDEATIDEVENENELCYSKSGICVSLSDGRVTSMKFYFRTEDGSYAAFAGMTDRGLGFESTPDDCFKMYGEPTSVFDYKRSKTLSLTFRESGTSCEFIDGKLYWIEVFEPSTPTWPREWRDHPFTDHSTWIVFAGEPGDGKWLEPVQHAQATFREFARIAELERFRMLPTFTTIAIKVFFEAVPGKPMFGEHMFLSNIFTDGKTITGTLDSSAWRRKDLKEGQEVTFPIEYLSDWFLVRGDEAWGGFTIPLVLDELSEDDREMAKQAPLFKECLSRNMDATEQLLALPVCKKCNQRNFMMEPSYDGGVCGICRNDGWRCDCPKCGAPLIRFPQAPKLCVRCMPKK